MPTFPSFPTRNIAGQQVGAIGWGAMNLTWKPEQTPDEQAFKTMKTAIDTGCTIFNSGEFYGHPERTLGLQLLSRFFEAEPTYADRTISPLRGFDQARPIEEAVAALKILADEGHFRHIGLSEVSASTIRRAHAVAPIAAVEAEYAPWALDSEQNGVLDVCKELGITVVAYSPLGGGFLAGSLKSPSDIPASDMPAHLDRFSPENFPKNLELVHKLTSLAEKKGITSTQLALAWNLAQWEGIIPIPGSTRAEGVLEAASAATISLSQEELDEIREVVSKADIVGGRYNARMQPGLAV